jgi:hypothetical protein
MFFNRKKKYCVVIEGSNLLMEMRGIERLGYFTTRYVEGIDEEEASQRALDLVSNELYSTGALLNKRGDPPRMVVSNIDQINSFRGKAAPGRGFTFFPEEAEAEDATKA